VLERRGDVDPRKPDDLAVDLGDEQPVRRALLQPLEPPRDALLVRRISELPEQAGDRSDFAVPHCSDAHGAYLRSTWRKLLAVDVGSRRAR
jgi:hypothetical protein